VALWVVCTEKLIINNLLNCWRKIDVNDYFGAGSGFGDGGSTVLTVLVGNV